MSKLGNWSIRGAILALALVSVTACVAYEPAPRYEYYDGPGVYYHGYYHEHWR